MAELNAPVRLFDTLCLGCGATDQVDRAKRGDDIIYRCRACGVTATAKPGEWPK